MKALETDVASRNKIYLTCPTLFEIACHNLQQMLMTKKIACEKVNEQIPKLAKLQEVVDASKAHGLTRYARLGLFPLPSKQNTLAYDIRAQETNKATIKLVP